MSLIYTAAKRGFGIGFHDWDDVTQLFKVILITTSDAPDPDQGFVSELLGQAGTSELSGTGYVAGFGGSGRRALTSRVVTLDTVNNRVELDADDPFWGTILAGTINAFVVIREQTSDTDSQLIAYIDDPAVLPIVTDGGDVTLQFNADGVFQLREHRVTTELITGRDTFTEASDTNLEDHISDSGLSWVKVGLSSTAVIRVDLGTLKKPSASRILYRTSLKSLVTEYFVEGKFTNLITSASDFRSPGLAGRVDVSAVKGYFVHYKSTGGGVYELYKMFDGGGGFLSNTLLGSVGLGASERTLRLELLDSGPRVTEGVTIHISSADTTYPGPGHPGIGSGFNAGSVVSTSNNLDDWKTNAPFGFVYTTAKRDFVRGIHDWDELTQAYKMMLVTAAYVPDVDHEFVGTPTAQKGIDTFTDTNGVLLENHVADSGHTWVKTTGIVGSADADIQGNQVRVINSTEGIYSSSLIPATPEYIVKVTSVRNGNNQSAGPAGRIDDAAGDAYYVRISGTGTDAFFSLHKVVGGGNTSLGVGQRPQAGSFTVTLELADSLKRVIVDGVSVFSTSDNTIPVAGSPGVYLRTDSVPSVNRLEDWSTGPLTPTIPGENEVSGFGYAPGFAGAGRRVVAGRTAIRNNADDRAEFKSDDVVWDVLKNFTTGDPDAVIIYREGTDDSDSQLIAYLRPSRFPVDVQGIGAGVKLTIDDGVIGHFVVV